jgi:cytoskeletal protein CcmA (bactofilin family)
MGPLAQDGSTNRSGTWLAPGLSIEGTIAGTGDVRIAARFKGKIEVSGGVTVDQDGSVEGEMRAGPVLIAGRVRGQVRSTSRVDLRETGTLIGAVEAEIVTIAEGSRMQASIHSGLPAAAGPPAAPPAAPPARKG